MIELLLQAERLLSVGLLDKAEQLYRQVAKADPKNSIAVVGLARVTLDRGDDEGALELARRAVAIDPENAAAQRLVARLEEVLEYRQSAESLLFDRRRGGQRAPGRGGRRGRGGGRRRARRGRPGRDECGRGCGGAGRRGGATGARARWRRRGTGGRGGGRAGRRGGGAPTTAAAPGTSTPPAAADPIGSAEVAAEPVAARPTPAAPPVEPEPPPASPSPTPLNAGPADPPWADVKVPEPEPAPPPPAVEPQVPYIPPSTSATAGDGAPTGILAYLERLFRRR